MLSTLYNLVLANNFVMIFFVLCYSYQFFFAMPIEIENARLKIALVIPTDVPITVPNDAREMVSLVADKNN